MIKLQDPTTNSQAIQRPEEHIKQYHRDMKPLPTNNLISLKNK
jgi:hypothetical protein